jgi:hypothetical protein
LKPAWLLGFRRKRTNLHEKYDHPKANPDHQLSKPLVYVGMTGTDPDLRFDKHKAGFKASRFVQLYGLRLLPALYEVYNPMPYEAAREMEVELAIALREAGYGVWQA